MEQLHRRKKQIKFKIYFFFLRDEKGNDIGLPNHESLEYM